ncbi:MAG: 2-oxoacid:acceptor oxidoreductase family protein [Planctomycetes bacterium]|nr:2-oxoacid:acceptor oxidoreductase family protein [Planctomycetota bacterium]
MRQQMLIRSQHFPTILCPGCGHGIVMSAMLRAIAKSGLSKNEIVLASGIGCASRVTGYVDFQTLHTTHGRALTFATGVAVARPEFKVIAIMGDGDATAIGGNHFIHAARRNVGMTAIIFNNNIYGMTGGQYSPTTPTASFASTAPYGNVEPPFDIVSLATAAGASFVARGSCTDPVRLENMILKALKCRGFSVVEAMSTCPTTYGPRNKIKTVEAYMDWLRAQCYDLSKKDKMTDEERRSKWGLGVFVDQPRPSYVEIYDRDVVPKAKAAVGEGTSIRPGEYEMPAGKFEIIIAGKAGQGIQKLGAILAETVIRDGNHAAQIENYGPAARTGISLTEVVAEGEPIDFPLVENANVLLAMTSEALAAHLPRVRRAANPIVLVDSTHVKNPPPGAWAVPVSATAKEEFGLPMAANVVMLGAFAAVSKLFTLASAEAVVARSVTRSVEQNLAALRRGYALGEGSVPVAVPASSATVTG